MWAERATRFEAAERAAAFRSFCATEWGAPDDAPVDAILGGAIAVQALLGVLDDLPEVTPSDVLHAEQHTVLVHPIDWARPVLAVATLGGIIRYATGAAVETSCIITDERGAALQRHSSIVTLPATIDAGDAPRPDRRVVARRDVRITTSTWRPDDNFPRRYAAVSGDDNPIHVDDNAARAVGLPGVILHGMSTLAFAVHAAWAARGGADVVTAFGTRFSRPVQPGDRIEAEVWSSNDPTILRVQVSASNGPALRDCYVSVGASSPEPAR